MIVTFSLDRLRKLLAVLGVMGVLPTADKHEAQAFSFGMVVARKLIILMWKSEHGPTHYVEEN